MASATRRASAELGPPGRVPAHEDRAAGGAHPLDRASEDRLVGLGGRRARREGPGGGLARERAPGRVGGEDEGGDLPGRAVGGAEGVGDGGGDLVGSTHPTLPALERAGERADVALERGVEAGVVGRVVAHDVEHRAVGATGVVQVRPAVGEPRTQVQERRGGSARDPGVPVGGAGGHPLEEAQYPADRGERVELCDEVHLRRAGVGEADRDVVGRQGGAQRVGPVHADVISSALSAGLRRPAGSKASLTRRRRARSAGSVRAR